MDRAIRALFRLTPDRPRLERLIDAAVGGKNNFAADRKLLIELVELTGVAVLRSLQAIPSFYQRVVVQMAQAGIDQLVVIGSGVPTGLSPGQQLHDVAQSMVPACRVVYIDSDPLMLATARATIEWQSDLIRVIEGDVRQLERLWADPVLSTFIDWRYPVGVVLGNLHELPEGERIAVAAHLRRVLCAGSYLAVLQAALDHVHPACATFDAILGARPSRTPDELHSMLAGLDLLRPGIVPISQWRPSTAAVQHAPDVCGVYGAVARLPTRQEHRSHAANLPADCQPLAAR